MPKYTVGIDVGGTNVKLGLISDSGKIIVRSRLDTKTYTRNKTKLINALIVAIDELLEEKSVKKKDIRGIGIGLPGLINPQKGIVNHLPNVPGWRNVPLKKMLEQKIKIKTFIENDVNLIALAEWKFGAGKGVKNLICMTLGTGVGAGIILNNCLYRGEGFAAGELGHVPLNEKGPSCNCGGEACFEKYVGNQTLMAKASKIFKIKNMINPQVYALANQGNTRAIQFFEELGTHIGHGLIGVINLLNPRLIIIGGGVSNNYKYFGKSVKDVVAKRCMKVQSKMVKIVRARLGDDAGIIGAQVLVKEHIH